MQNLLKHKFNFHNFPAQLFLRPPYEYINDGLLSSFFKINKRNNQQDVS